MAVGTEDGEALEARLPHCGLSIDGDPFVATRAHVDGLEVLIPKVEVGTAITLHFIVAENPFPEPVALSTWFAVDLNHANVLAQRA